MEENEKTKFKSVPAQKNISYNDSKEKSNFTKTILLPFISGIVGCIIVLGTCFGIPSIKSRLLNNNSNISSSNNNSTKADGYVSQVNLNEYSNTSIFAANKVLPSIVGIKIEYTISSNSFLGRPTSTTASAAGSGIIISEDGYILTNNHVVSSSSSDLSTYYQISEASKITITLFNDETEYEAKIVGKDKQTDLAVLKIDKSGLTAAEFADSDSVKVGQFAMAVGNPVGMNSTVTSGIISALNRTVRDSDGNIYTCIQTDAAINSGNSGGALVNSEGKVIGINTLKLSGTGIEGIGFAIPINSTTDIVSQLIQYNKVKRPFIGITGIDLDEETASKNKLVIGVYVKDIEEFSAAEKAGIKIGDVIIEADGKKISTMNELNTIKSAHNIGDTITIKVNRNGQEKTLNVTLGEE